jgi:PAS domain S-box-containing protein
VADDPTARLTAALRRLIHTTKVAGAVVDRHGTFLHVSPALAALVGQSSRTLTGTRLEQCVIPAYRAHCRTLLAASARQPTSQGEVLVATPTGQCRCLHLTLRRMPRPWPACLTVVAVDLTRTWRRARRFLLENAELEARVQAQTGDLAAQQALLETVLDQATEGIVVRDAAGRVVLVNRAAARRAWAPPAGTGLPEAPAIWGETRDAAGQALPLDTWPITRALQGETARKVDWHRVAPDGTPYVVRSTAAPVRDAAGAVIAAVEITTDVTAPVQAQAAPCPAPTQEQAAHADDAALLREVHHRVNNHLQLLCDLLSMQADAAPDPARREAVAEAYGRIFTIARLHADLSRCQQGGQVRLEDYFGQLAGHLREACPHAALRFDPPPEPISLDLDRALRAGLILNELVTAAGRDAVPPGAPGAITVGLRTRGDRVELQVRDTGSGRPATGVLPDRTAVGLRIVRVLARGLHADLDVDTTSGTAITLSFPLHADAPVEPREG